MGIAPDGYGRVMGAKRGIKRVFERLTGTHVYRTVPRGIDLFHDIRRYLPELQVNVVFDVGANQGQSARKYLSSFPGATIYCFEPVENTFLQLQENLRGRDNVHIFKLALGAVRGMGAMVTEGGSDMFFLLRASSQQASGASRLEEVELATLDGFCGDNNIDQIDYLKIDTEGGDLDVLKGADRMLTRHQVDVVEVEAGMNGRNMRHVPFDVFGRFFEDKSYFLFGIYEQMNEWPKREPHLRRTNPVFISEKVIKANTAR